MARAKPRRAAPTGGLRRALLLIIGTIVLPGSAQFLAGGRRLGAVVMCGYGILLVALGIGYWKFRPDRAQLIGWFTDPDILATARIVGVVVVVLWLALFADAWRLALLPGMGWWRVGLVSVIGTTIVALVSASTLLSWNTVTASRDVVTQVFSEKVVSNPLKGRYNILLLGADSGSGRTGLRPDSLNVASIDASTGATVMVSLPRNLQNVPFPEDSPMHAVYPYGYNCGSECLLNAVHTAAENRTDLYPDSKDPGLDATIDAVEGVTGLQINYYVMVNMKGFSSLVDAVGGVEIDVKTPIAMFGHDDAWKQEYIQPGKQTLNGRQALWYGRSRVQSDDYVRMGRQKCLMEAMLQQLSPQQVILNAGSIAKSSAAMLSTNIPSSELGAFGDLALKARGTKIATLSVVPPEYSTVTPDFEVIRADVAALVKKSEQAAKKAQATPSTQASSEPSVTATPSPTATATGSSNNTDDLRATC